MSTLANQVNVIDKNGQSKALAKSASYTSINNGGGNPLEVITYNFNGLADEFFTSRNNERVKVEFIRGGDPELVTRNAILTVDPNGGLNVVKLVLQAL